MVNKLHNKQIDIDEIEMDDPGIYRLISEGNTAGIFQLESAGMTQFMKELQPSCLEDIIAGISLYSQDQWTKYRHTSKTRKPCQNNLYSSET